MNEKVNRFRNIPVKFYTTEIERELIDEKAKQCSLSRSGYLLRIAIDGIIVIQDLDTMRGFTYEVNKIGTNINQIAKEINTMGSIHKQDIEEIKKQMGELYKIINKLIETYHK